MAARLKRERIVREVNYVAPAESSGYACAAAGYMRLLQAAGVCVHHQPLQPGPAFGLWYECVPTDGTRLALHAPTILHVVPEYYPQLTRWLREKGVRGPILGMTVWETSRLPKHWPDLLNQVDALIVPSEWNRSVFTACGVDVPIHTLPHTSEFQGEPAEETAIQSLKRRLPEMQGRFLFYSVGAWSYRKGNDILIKAFRKAFGDRTDVALVLKTSDVSFDAPATRWRRVLGKAVGDERLRRRALAGGMKNVVLITDTLAADEMRALHTLGDCYVSCARGEGWGLGLYEAIFFGKPVIAPDQGGHRDYLRDDEYCGLIASRPVPVRPPGNNPSYQPDQEWFEIAVEDAARKMFFVVSNYQDVVERSARLSQNVQSRCNEQSIQEQLIGILDATGKITPKQLV